MASLTLAQSGPSLLHVGISLFCPRLQVEEKDQEWEKRARQTRQQALLDLDDAVRKERVAGQGRIQEVIER